MALLLIDEQLIFDEDSFLLYRTDAPGDTPLRLGAIASRCLALLLRSSGTVVRKRDLMAAAWGQYGLEVTDNSLAQVVRQLRLALEKLQPEREFIQTLPRIGYKLLEGVRIVELSATGTAALIVKPPQVGSDLPDYATSTDTQDEALEPAEVPPSGVPVEPAERLTPSAASNPAPPWRWWLWLALPLWGGLAFGLGTVWQRPEQAAVPQFLPPVTVQGLRIYLPVSGLASVSQPRLQAISQRIQQLTGLVEIAQESAHLYLLPTRHGGQAILCQDELEATNSRCVGVLLHD